MDELTRLVAICDIQTLVARRVRALDGRDWDTYLSCHAPEHRSTVFADATDRREMMASLRAETEGVSAIHHVHSPEIELLSSTEATGIWAMEDRRYWMQGDERHWLHGWGHYHETYVKRDGAWLISSRDLRRVRVDHSPGSNRSYQY